MIKIDLTETTRQELEDLRRQDIPAKVRDRLDMILLAETGWQPARIATYLGYCYRTVLKVLHDFRCRGREALTPRRRGPAPNLTYRRQVTDLLQQLLAQERTWTSRQLSDALLGQGLRIGPRHLRRYLKQLRAGYRRTASTLKHKQDPAKAAHAQGVLLNLQQRADAGLLELYYLDECGFSPSLPTGYSWALPGERKRVKYEYPQGRRVNALAAYRAYGPAPRLDAQLFERTLTSDDLIAYLKERLPGAWVPRVVVLDNASLHISKVTKAARPELAKLGIYLYYLPAYSPELNEIEPVFKQVKHHEIPQRSHTSKAELRGSVEQGFDSYGRKLHPKSVKKLRPAA